MASLLLPALLRALVASGDLAEVAAAALAAPGVYLGSCRGSVSGLATATCSAQCANDSGRAVRVLVARGDLAEVAAAALAAPGIYLGSRRGGVSGLAATSSIAQGANDSGCAVRVLVASGDLAEVAAAALAAPGVYLGSCRGSVSGLATATCSAQCANDSGRAVRVLVARGDLAEVAPAALTALGVHLDSGRGGMSGVATASSIAQGANDSGCAVWVIAACRNLAEVAAAHICGLVSNIISPA